MPFDANEIADFLAKPYIVASGTIATTDAANASITSFAIGAQLTANTLWKNKWEGYKLIRADAVIKLVVNANPFQAGRLISTFIPAYTHLTAGEQAARNVNLAQVTTQPNVELNIADSSSEMRIPYVAPTNYYDLVTGYIDWGTYFLRVLSPLVTGSGGETSFPYQIFLSFENVELAAPIFPESAQRMGPSANGPKLKRNNVASLRLREQGAVSDGSPSGMLAGVSNIAGDIGSILSHIPGVAPVTEAISNWSGIASDVLSLFGWSKPLITSSVAPFVQRPYFQMQNATSGTMSDVLAISHDPQLPPAEQVYGASMDEMSFAYLKKVWSLFSVLPWKDSDVTTTRLAEVEVSPYTLSTAYVKVAGTATVDCLTGSPLFVMAPLFSAYRGGIEIELKFVKTKFHTGRLAVTFTPVQLSYSSITLATGEYVLREIIDLKDSDSVVLKLPYMYAQEYLHVWGGTGYSNFADATGSSLGTLDITVLSQLRAPETVSDTVNVLMYVRPGDDFEYAGPISKKPFLPFSPESALSSTGAKVSKSMGNANVGTTSLESNALAFNDPILSIKQLMVIPRKFMSSSSVLDDSATAYRIFPYANSFAQSATNVLTYFNGATYSMAGDWYNIFSAAYAFERGSMRIMNSEVSTSGNATAVLEPHSGAVQSISQDTTTAAAYDFDQGAGYQLAYRPAPNACVRTALAGALDVLLPHWGKTPMRLVRHQTSAAPLATNTVPGTYGYDLLVFGRAFSKTKWYRSVADDFSLGYFIGFPPMAYGTHETI